MADCDFTIVFGDTADTVITGAGTDADPIIVTLQGDICVNCVAATLAADGTLAITQTNGTDITINRIVSDCQVAGPNGLTGTQVGAEVIGCSVPSLSGTDPTSAGFAPATFPARWRQHFTDGASGDEVWIVLAGADGNLDWHQLDG